MRSVAEILRRKPIGDVEDTEDEEDDSGNNNDDDAQSNFEWESEKRGRSLKTK